MPTCNRAELIMTSVNSILHQTYQNWELLIMDDGSTDDTAQIIQSVDDPRIVYHRLEHCGSPGRLKNEGLRLCSGTLIAFNDSDDLWHPDKLRKQVNALESNPDAGFCVANGYNFRDNPALPLNFVYPRKEGFRSGNLFLACFQSELAAFTQALVFKKSCLDKTGYFDEERIHDRTFIVSLAFHYAGLIIYEPLFFRRLHDHNFSKTKWQKDYRYERALIESYKTHLPNKIYKNSLFKLYVQWGETYAKHQYKSLAAKSYFKAWRFNPLSLAPLKKIGKLILRSH